MATTALPAPQPELFGQPSGLWILAGTELWERISFHGMQALLVLYMVGALLLPGHVEHVAGFPGYRAAVEWITGPLSVQALAAQTFGLYIGLIYFTPVLGGIVGDRLLGRRASVILGGVLMTSGHFALAFDRSFLIALLLLILGAGLLRGNLSAQVKSLYADGDRREADAFQIYYVGINLGAFIAPIVTGALAVVYGWHIGFGFAGFGMLVGLIVYLAGARHLPRDVRRKTDAFQIYRVGIKLGAFVATIVTGVLAIIYGRHIGFGFATFAMLIALLVYGAGARYLLKRFPSEAATRVPLTPGERRRVAALFALCPFLICFWIAQSQVWNVYNLWVRDHLNLMVGSFRVPIPWLQALDGVSPILVMPIFLALWRRQAARGTEPDDLKKMAIGCLIFGAGTAWLALAPLVSGPDGRAPLAWAVMFHLSTNTGWLYFTPIAVALFAAKSPAGLRGTMIGINYLTTFAGSVISGRLGGFYERMSAPHFWLLHAAIVGAGGLSLLILARPLRGWFRDDGATTGTIDQSRFDGQTT